MVSKGKKTSPQRHQDTKNHKGRRVASLCHCVFVARRHPAPDLGIPPMSRELGQGGTRLRLILIAGVRDPRC
jgi:hypothetical protein